MTQRLDGIDTRISHITEDFARKISRRKVLGKGLKTIAGTVAGMSLGMFWGLPSAHAACSCSFPGCGNCSCRGKTCPSRGCPSGCTVCTTADGCAGCIYASGYWVCCQACCGTCNLGYQLCYDCKCTGCGGTCGCKSNCLCGCGCIQNEPPP